MLNASGKAKTTYDRNGLMNSITYHADDRAAAIAELARVAPPGSALVAVYQGRGNGPFHDFYVISADIHDNGRPWLHYISKLAGAVLGTTVYERKTYQGINTYPEGVAGTARALSEAVFGGPDAYTVQEIR